MESQLTQLWTDFINTPEMQWLVNNENLISIMTWFVWIPALFFKHGRKTIGRVFGLLGSLLKLTFQAVTLKPVRDMMRRTPQPLSNSPYLFSRVKAVSLNKVKVQVAFADKVWSKKCRPSRVKATEAKLRDKAARWVKAWMEVDELANPEKGVVAGVDVTSRLKGLGLADWEKIQRGLMDGEYASVDSGIHTGTNPHRVNTGSGLQVRDNDLRRFMVIFKDAVNATKKPQGVKAVELGQGQYRIEKESPVDTLKSEWAKAVASQASYYVHPVTFEEETTKPKKPEPLPVDFQTSKHGQQRVDFTCYPLSLIRKWLKGEVILDGYELKNQPGHFGSISDGTNVIHLNGKWCCDKGSMSGRSIIAHAKAVIAWKEACGEKA